MKNFIEARESKLYLDYFGEVGPFTRSFFSISDSDEDDVLNSLRSLLKNDLYEPLYFLSLFQYFDIVNTKRSNFLVKCYQLILSEYPDIAKVINTYLLNNADYYHRLVNIFSDAKLLALSKDNAMYRREDPLEPFIINDDIDGFQKYLLEHPKININHYTIIIQGKPPTYVYDMIISDAHLFDLAAFYGSVKIFKYLFLSIDKKQANLKWINGFAIAGGCLEIVRILEQKGFGYYESITTAAVYHRYEICDWLFNQYGPALDLKLYRVIKSFNYEAIVYMISHGANVEYLGRNSWTPLHDAVSIHDILIVKFLVEHCSSNKAAKTDLGSTPLDFARMQGDQKIIKFLEQP